MRLVRILARKRELLSRLKSGIGSDRPTQDRRLFRPDNEPRCDGSVRTARADQNVDRCPLDNAAGSVRSPRHQRDRTVVGPACPGPLNHPLKLTFAGNGARWFNPRRRDHATNKDWGRWLPACAREGIARRRAFPCYCSNLFCCSYRHDRFRSARLNCLVLFYQTVFLTGDAGKLSGAWNRQ